MQENSPTGKIRIIILYGLLLGGALAAFKFFEYSFLARRITFDIYIGVVAVAFLLVGIIVGMKGRSKPSSPPAEASGVSNPVQPLFQPELPSPPPDHDLSKRELEVLAGLVHGMTNQQIADHLYVSPNTVKTHVSNIYRKLDVERRAQAVARAKEWNILQ